ncbi:hypothetical protein RYA05_02430 [Pseudomonas syringae pv. actinidiae]|nr:hypothetical protein [Pseudomonas syringae pv. actinidiae]
MKHLIPSTTERLDIAVKEFDGMIALAHTIPDKEMAERVVSKLEARKSREQARYGEIENADGSVLVKHPAIGFITIDEDVCETAVRLFGSRVKSMSSLRVRVHHADALIGVDGNVTYVNRTVLLDVEMSQAAFASVISNPGRGQYAATIREHRGVAVEYQGDVGSERNRVMVEHAVGSTEGLNSWVNKLMGAFEESSKKPGPMSGAARQELSKDASTLESWTKSNPAFYASQLAELADQTTTDMKLEVMALRKIKEKN